MKVELVFSNAVLMRHKPWLLEAFVLMSWLWWTSRRQTFVLNMCCDHSVVGVVTTLGTGRFGAIFTIRTSFLSCPRRSNQRWGLLSLLFNGYGVLSQGVTRLRSEDDHSSPCSAKVKKEWSYTCAVHMCPYRVKRGSCLRTLYKASACLSAVTCSLFITK
jgi:hypothetical protein